MKHEIIISHFISELLLMSSMHTNYCLLAHTEISTISRSATQYDLFAIWIWLTWCSRDLQNRTHGTLWSLGNGSHCGVVLGLAPVWLWLFRLQLRSLSKAPYSGVRSYWSWRGGGNLLGVLDTLIKSRAESGFEAERFSSFRKLDPLRSRAFHCAVLHWWYEIILSWRDFLMLYAVFVLLSRRTSSKTCSPHMGSHNLVGFPYISLPLT